MERDGEFVTLTDEDMRLLNVTERVYPATTLLDIAWGLLEGAADRLANAQITVSSLMPGDPARSEVLAQLSKDTHTLGQLEGDMFALAAELETDSLLPPHEGPSEAA